MRGEHLKVEKVEKGNIRVDLPIWFGDFPTAKVKIVFLGLEPRHTHDKYNIEKVGNYVYGTPFGVEHWKSENTYYKSFSVAINDQNVFCYFSDVVKEYVVKSTDNKKSNDKFNRDWFCERANDNTRKAFLRHELKIISPDIIIALGNDSYCFLKAFLGDKYNIQKVRHPAHGGSEEAKDQLSKLETKNNLKHWLHVNGFTLGLLLLMGSRGYEPAVRFVGCLFKR